jgi:hypothetical protein
MAANIRSICGLSVGVRGAALVTLICTRSHAWRNVDPTYTLPRSMVIDSGTITGLAAMLARTSSSPGIIPAGRIEREKESDACQPGCIGSGVSARASSTAASTLLVATGRRIAAHGVLVAMSNAAVRSTRPVEPSGYTTIRSSEVLSISTSSPGRDGDCRPHGRSGRLAWVRWVVACPNGCREPARLSTARYKVGREGIANPSCVASRLTCRITRDRVPVERVVCALIACSSSDTNAGSIRPVGDACFVLRPSTRPATPSLR